MKLREKIYNVLSPLYGQVALSQEPSGRFRTPSLKYTIYGQYAGIFFAWLYSLKRPDNQFYKDPETLQRAVDGWNFYATQISPEGMASIITYDQYWYDSVDEWGCYYWMNTIELLNPYLDAETVNRWKRCIDRIIVAIEEKAKNTISAPEYFPKISNGAVNNHFVWTLLCLYRHAMLNGNDESLARNRERLEYIIQSQLPSGTWMEEGTVVIGYGEVTICAISLFELFDGNPIAATAVRRNLQYRLNTFYPNFRGNDCLEGRISYSNRIFPYTAPTFCHYPEGRIYLSRWMDYIQYEQPIGRRLHEALQGLAVISDLACHLPETEETKDTNLPAPAPEILWPDIKSGIHRDGKWITTMCCLSPSPLKSRWIMERQNLISIFHVDHGLIIGGGHSISQPEFSTFNIISKGVLHYLHNNGELGENRMNLRYGEHNCHVAMRSVNDSVHLHYQVKDLQETEIARVNIPLWMNASSLVIGDKVFDTENEFLFIEVLSDEILEMESIQITSSLAARLQYPICPFNPYHKNIRDAPDSNKQAILTIELTDNKPKCEITIRHRPRNRSK